MENGIRMVEARDEKGHLRSLDSLRSDYQAGMAMPQLYCPDKCCHCRVRFVPRGLRGGSRMTRAGVQGHYLDLAYGASHTAACYYNTQHQLALILASAEPNLITASKRPPLELTLLCIRNALQGKSISPTRPAAGLSTAGSDDCMFSEAQLFAHLHTLQTLLTLRARCGSDDYLAAQLSLRFGVLRIAWKAFYFENRYDAAWLSVKRGRSTMYPIALEGEVQAVTQPKPGAASQHCHFSCVPLSSPDNRSGQCGDYEVSVYHCDIALRDKLTVGSQVIMFGLWEFRDAGHSYKSGEPSAVATQLSRKLILHTRFQPQVFLLTPRTGQPSCVIAAAKPSHGNIIVHAV